MTTDTLPPLPEPQALCAGAFTADQMREYGKACAALPAAQPINPPEFQEVSWGVNSVMRPCLGMAVSEYAFRQWAQDVGVVLAAPVAAQPTSGVQPSPAPSWEEVRYFFAIMMFGATGKARASWERAIDEAADGGPGPLRDLKAHLTAGVQEVRNAD
jgi:hypothetical protein